jgi:hypothetical protein
MRGVLIAPARCVSALGRSQLPASIAFCARQRRLPLLKSFKGATLTRKQTANVGFPA